MIRVLRTWLSAAAIAAAPFGLWGQETRGAIFGVVTDPHGSVVAAAKIAVTNVDTNVTTDLRTNESGYYTADLIVAGSYMATAEYAGFSKAVRKEIVVPIGTRVQVDFKLELGAVGSTVTVSAGAETINTDTLSSGGVTESKSALDLANPGVNTMVLAKFEPGVQSFQSIADSSVRLHSTGAAANLSIFGNTGANEYSVDGMPNNAASPAAAWPAPSSSGPGPGYMPAPELVEAMKVETSGFDASFGHGAGASISMMTRAGTNQWHGGAREYFQNYKWDALDFFTGTAYNQRIAQAAAAGNNALAQQLREQGGHQPGRDNQFSATLGGPVVIPKLFNGRNKLFFFFGEAGFRVTTISQSYAALPTGPMRTGDFSSLLNIAVNGVNQGSLYQIYDPLSATADPTRSGHVVRTPFPNNIVPQSRITNPMYAFYNKLFPLPNNISPDPTAQPNQDEISYSNRGTERYDSYANRMDYNLSETDRFMFRWSWNQWGNMGGSQYLAATSNPIVNSSGQNRRNLGGGVNWVHTFGPRAVLNVSFGANDWHIWQVDPGFALFTPSATGLPAYMDQLASASEVLPNVTFNGWTGLSQGLAQNTQHNTSDSIKADFSFLSSHHTTKVGIDARRQFNTFQQYGNNAGLFSFSNTWTERTDDGYQNAGTGAYGGSWASFMMGLPSTLSIDNNSSQALTNPYYGVYVQDSWRVTPRLTLNYGLRVEYEFGPTERYNRMLGEFDPTAQLPISAAAEAAYAANTPAGGIPPSQFVVQGGNTYVGLDGTGRKLWENQLEWEPRLALAYQLNNKTVLRTGAGRYYDTFNVFSIANNGTTLSQQGFSNTTTTTLSNNFGQTWLVGNPAAGISPLTDPFPVLGNGGREISPLGSALGPMATVGKGYTYFPYDRPHTRQDRWRLDIQRMIDNASSITVGYAGSYSQHLPLSQSASAVPAQYWSFSDVQNNTVANNWNANVTNPFYLNNFSGLQSSNPSLYNYMANNSFFTSPTITQSKLWVPYAQMNGLNVISDLGRAKTEELDIAFQRRFAKGLNLNVAYTRLWNYAADYFPNPFDAQPAWEPSNNGRPQRLVSTAVYELPAGKGRRYFKSGPASWILGGYQISVIQEYQPGPLITWSSTLYYSGNPTNICNGPQTIGEWFNTTGFQTNPALEAVTGQARVFPNEINWNGACRAQSIKNFNVSALRTFRIKERASLDIRVDAYNVANHQQLSAPVTSPTSSQFGQITGDNSAVTRAVIFYGRLTF
jgi:Carboxypeptidase regulatory-like domain